MYSVQFRMSGFVLRLISHVCNKRACPSRIRVMGNLAGSRQDIKIQEKIRQKSISRRGLFIFIPSLEGINKNRHFIALVQMSRQGQMNSVNYFCEFCSITCVFKIIAFMLLVPATFCSDPPYPILNSNFENLKWTVQCYAINISCKRKLETSLYYHFVVPKNWSEFWPKQFC